MKAVVEWLLERRHRVVLLAMAMSPLLPLGSTALLALDTARNGVPQGLTSAAFGVGGVLLLALLAGANVQALATLAVISFGAGVILGALLVRGGNSLTMAFQGLALLSLLAVVAVSLLGPDPRALFGPAVEEFIEMMRAGGAEEAQLEAIRGWEPLIFGLLAALVFVQWVFSLFLAHWWLGLVDDEVSFGQQFRSLGMGRQLGVAALVLVALPLVSGAAVVQNLAILTVAVFLFQGLAVLHAWAHARRWHPLVLVPVYVLLVTPFSLLVILGLSSAGLVDNVFDLRAQLRAST